MIPTAPAATNTTVAAAPRSGDVRLRAGWSPTVRVVLAASGWYFLNRLVCGLALVLSAWLAGPRFSTRSLLLLGDGRWYLDMAKVGYFDLPPTPTGGEALSSIGFFPLLPGLIRVVDAALPGGGLLAALAVCTLAGWAASIAVTLLARDLYGEAAAHRAAALLACFPGAFIFTFVYTEGLLVAAAAAALLLLRHERWVLAGLAGAVATSARPSGVAVVAATAVAAALAIRRNRDWSSIAAPVLASCGIGSYFAYLWNRTGDPTAWFTNQHDFWQQRNNLGGFVLDWLLQIGDYDVPVDHRLFGLVVLALIPAVAYFVRHRPDAATTAYVAASLVITLTSNLGPRPRFLLAAFPLLLPVAARLRGAGHRSLLAAGFALLVLTMIYYASGIPLAIDRLDFYGPIL